MHRQCFENVEQMKWKMIEVMLGIPFLNVIVRQSLQLIRANAVCQQNSNQTSYRHLNHFTISARCSE